MQLASCAVLSVAQLCWHSAWGLSILAGVHMAICLVITLVICWPMWLQPYVHSFPICQFLPCFHIAQSSSQILLVKRFVQFFHGHNTFNLKIIKAY